MADPVLKQPSKSKGYFSQITALEWFKLRYNNGPWTAMILKGSVTSLILMVNKDGEPSVRNYTDIAAHGEFLGYLTTEESVTFHGSLDPNWVEPEPPLPVPISRPELKKGDHMSRVPDFIPYRMDSMGQQYDVINVPCDKYGRNRIGLCFPVDRTHQHIWSGFGVSETFQFYLGETSIERWKVHNQISYHHVQDPATWPT